jgi:predicted RNase H-like HicB family nuclease
MGTGNETETRRDFTVIVERDEDGNYVASVPALAGCHTQARSLDELVQRVQEAIALCLEDADAAALPSLEFVGVQRITVPA